MAATLIEIGDGLVERLATIKGLRAYDHVPDVWAVPCAWTMPETVEYWNSFGGGDVQHVYTVTLVVGRTADRQAQKSLYEFMSYSGTRSVRAAIEGDRTLGGRVQTLLVERADNIQIIQQGDASYLACDFRCRVHA
jgi:hypothetical protein